MAHSDAYNAFFKHMNATGMEFAYGSFDPNLLSKINPEEREEIEDAIFYGTDTNTDLFMYLPQLKKYNGTAYLMDLLSERRKSGEKPIRLDAVISKTLYEATGDEQYLDTVFEVCDRDKYTSLSILLYIKPCRKIYDYMTDKYINSDDEKDRSIAADAMLCYKGYLKNPLDLNERKGLLDFMRSFMSDDPEERKEIAAKLECGELKP